MKAHLLFEQSGTFKKEFKKFGWEAEDYDILNEFNETDHQIDLYNEIEKGYNEESSIFDNFTSEDYILAFFPCTRFEAQIIMHIRGYAKGLETWSEQKKLENNLKLMGEVQRNYSLITKLVLICMKRNIKLIIENPYSEQHFLTRYWTIRPSIIHYNRRKLGDWFVKPTQYWFINCKPKNNLYLEDIEERNELKTVEQCARCDKERSLISPVYANRFIREYILDEIIED